MTQSAIFHLSIPIQDTVRAKQFYGDALGCAVGRENKTAVIFNFYGTQLIGHITKERIVPQSGIYPRHLGLILPTKQDWQQICDRAIEHKLTFREQPKLRFQDRILEHHTFFLEDPFYNLLEFKYYRHQEVVFGGRQENSIGDAVAQSH